MTDPVFEQQLGALIRDHSRAALRPIDRHAIAGAAIAQGRGTRMPRIAGTRSRRWVPLLGLAAALLLPATGLFVAGQVGPTPSPSPSPSPSVVTWDAVLVRPEPESTGQDSSVVHVVLASAAGTERPIRSIDAGSLSIPIPSEAHGFTGEAVAAQDGWLALHVRSWLRHHDRDDTMSGRSSIESTFWWALVSLRDADLPITLVPYGSGDHHAQTAAAWAPGGRFATLCPQPRPEDGTSPCADVILPALAVQVVDARAGTTRVVEGVTLPRRDDQQRVSWAADGSGLLTLADRIARDELLRIRDERSGVLIPGWDPGVDPLDDGPRTRGVPALASTPLRRWIVEGGRRLEQPDRLLEADDPRRALRQRVPDGFALRESSLAIDGRSVWLLLAEPIDVPRWLAVARATGSATPDVLANASSIALPSAGTGYFAGFAPDDSVIALGVVDHWSAMGAKVALAPTDGAPVHVHAGRFAGFVPADLLP